MSTNLISYVLLLNGLNGNNNNKKQKKANALFKTIRKEYMKKKQKKTNRLFFLPPLSNLFLQGIPHTWVHLIQNGYLLLESTMGRHLKLWPLEILTGIVEVLFRSKKSHESESADPFWCLQQGKVLIPTQNKTVNLVLPLKRSQYDPLALKTRSTSHSVLVPSQGCSTGILALSHRPGDALEYLHI